MQTLNNSGKEFNMSRQTLIIKSLAPYLSQIFGYNALLYSPLAKKLCENNLSIKNQFIIGNDIEKPYLTHLYKKNQQVTASLSLKCHYQELPIVADCIDLAVLPNILQNSLNPHQVLREVERTLIPEGVVILIGRNPFSWQAIKVAYKRWLKNRKHPKRRSQISDISKRRISDWFGLLGFKTENQISISVTNDKIQNSHAYFWIKKISQFFCDYFCSYYIIIASKRVSTLTPIRPSWRSNKQLVPPRMAEPSVKALVENWVRRIKQQ